MELKSLVEIEVTSASAKKGSDEIISSLEKTEKAVESTTEAAKQLNKEFQKTEETVAPAVATTANKVVESAKRITESNDQIKVSNDKVKTSTDGVVLSAGKSTIEIEKNAVAYSAGAKSARTFSEAVAISNQNAASFPLSGAKSILAYGTAFLSVSLLSKKVLDDNRQFETGMIGVAKTTNLAGDDLINFKNKILDISKNLPVSTNELLDLAQAAGQMGVRGSENLEKFAVTMAKVGRSTDLSGADAARGLARILTVSGEGTDQLETLANVIVRLGNNSKATESEISGMTTEISQALSVYGIASAQSVALAAAMKSVGIRAELGGSAVGRAMQQITNAVLAGGKQLDFFSRSLGLDSVKLKELFNTDKIQAFNYFLEGVASKGLGAGNALKEINLGGEEIAKSLIPLATHLDVIRDAQAQANDEVKRGTALNNEFNATLKTFDSQLMISKNIAKSYGMELSSGVFKSITSGLASFNEAAKNGGLNRLNDLINVLAIGIGGRLAGSLFISLNAFRANQVEIFRYNLALAEMAGISRTAAVSQLALGTATRAAGGAMALMGGPVGVVLIAASAILYFTNRTTDSEARLNSYGDTLDTVVDKFRKMGDAQRSLAVLDLTKGIDETEKKLKGIEGALDFNKNGNGKGSLTNETLLTLAKDAELTKEKLHDMREELAYLKDPQGAEEAKRYTDALKEWGQNASEAANKTKDLAINTANVSKESEDLLRNVKKQHDLFNVAYRDNAAEVEFLYDLENGLIEIKDEKLRNSILLQYRKIDADKKEQQHDEAMMVLEDVWLKKQTDNIKDNLAIRKAISEDEFKTANENNKKLEDAYKKNADESAKVWEESAKRIDGTFADAWGGAFKSFTSFRDQMQDGFKKMVGELIHQATTKKLTDALLQLSAGSKNLSAMKAWGAQSATLDNAFESAPIVSSAGSAGGLFGSSGGSSGGGGGLGGLGALAGGANPYILGAVAIAAAITVWNKSEDARFVKMGSDYKQANQGLSKILGEGNKKSETINTTIEKLKITGGETLGVNEAMLDALLDIRIGIQDVAAGFAKTLTGSSDYKAMGIKTGESTGRMVNGAAIFDYKKLTNVLGPGFGKQDTMIGDFLNSLTMKISSMLYSKKSKVIDSGINVIGTGLADLLTGATIQAFNYADVQSQKKLLGIKYDTKVKRSTEELDDTFKNQFTDVFRNAGNALKEASKPFGINFDDYVNKLQVKTQDLSLKGLTGDALQKEIESFFGSTLDDWANTLLSGTSILQDFQKVGESSFDTMVRLASETNVFKSYIDVLGLNLKATGVQAISATQAMAEAAGGFDALTSKLSVYYDKFFSSDEKFAVTKQKIVDTFKTLNLSLPTSREGFKQLVSSMDLLTDSGRDTENKLLDLAPLLDQYYTQLGDLQETTNKNNLLSAQQLLDYSNKLLDVADSLLTSDLSPLSGMEKLSVTQNKFRTASGDDLGQAAQDYLQQARDVFASGADYVKIFAEVQKRLRDEAASAIAGNQPSTGSTSSAAIANSANAISNSGNSTVSTNQPAANDSVVSELVEINKALSMQADVNTSLVKIITKQNELTNAQYDKDNTNVVALNRSVEGLVDFLEKKG